MPELLEKGGIFMWFIVGCSVVAFAITLERLFHLHRAHINATDFMKGIRNLLQRNNPSEALVMCQETPGPVAHILRAAILKHDAPREEIRQAIEDAAVGEVPRLERNLALLATFAQVAPLLGLLGTVSGFIRVFDYLSSQSAVQLRDLSHGVMEALFCTAGGLVVAIFCYLAYNYLVTRVQRIVTDMEKCSGEILALLTERQKKLARSSNGTKETAAP